MLNKIVSAFALFAAVMASCMTLYLAWQDKTGSATLTAGFAIMLFLLTNMSRIEFFKGWGIETRIREQIERAEIALEEAKSIAEAFSRQAYVSMTHIGRLSAPTWEDRFDLSRDIAKMMKITKSNDASSVEARTRFERMFAIDAAHIYHGFRNDRLSKRDERTELVHDHEFLSRVDVENYQSVLLEDIPRKALTSDDIAGLEEYIISSTASIKISLKDMRVDPYLQGAINHETEAKIALYKKLFNEEPHGTIY